MEQDIQFNHVKKPFYPKNKESISRFNELRNEVNDIVRQLAPKREWKIKVRAILFPLLYLGFYLSILFWGNNPWVFYGSYICLGLLLVMIFASIIHDAVHGAIFKSKFLNNLYVRLFDLMGANSYIWRIRHNRLHHPYPNVMGWDSDFEQSPIVRVFPQAPFKNFQKYQHIYLPFVYPLYLFNWLLIRDFKDFYGEKAIVRKVIDKIPFWEHVKLFAFKAFFLIYLIVIPKFVLDIGWGHALLGFVVMIFTASITSLIVLLSSHANIDSTFPEPDNSGRMPTPWFVHQIVCTNDIEENNWFTRFFLGSFNYHLAHHLFPNIPGIYMPEVTQAVERFSKKYKLPYRRYPLVKSLYGHYLLLKHNSKNNKVFNVFEETM